MAGEVEVDEAYVRAVGTKVRGRRAKGKTIVAIPAEVRGRGLGKIRMAMIPYFSASSLRRFVGNNVQMGAELITDAWSGYNGIEVMGYKHIVTKTSNSGDTAHVVMARVHRVASLFDRQWLGIHQGAIRPSYLDYYHDEFTFRFNKVEIQRSRSTLLPSYGAGRRLSSRATQNDYRWQITKY